MYVFFCSELFLLYCIKSCFCWYLNTIRKSLKCWCIMSLTIHITCTVFTTFTLCPNVYKLKMYLYVWFLKGCVRWSECIYICWNIFVLMDKLFWGLRKQLCSLLSVECSTALNYTKEVNSHHVTVGFANVGLFVLSIT